MASREEKVSLFRLIGLNDQKIEETLKNETLSTFLAEIVTIANKAANNKDQLFDKIASVLLYQLATKLKSQIRNRLSFFSGKYC